MKKDLELYAVLVEEIFIQINKVYLLLSNDYSDEDQRDFLNCLHALNGTSRLIDVSKFSRHCSVLEYVVQSAQNKSILLDKDTRDILREGVEVVEVFSNDLKNKIINESLDFESYEKKINLVSSLLGIEEFAVQDEDKSKNTNLVNKVSEKESLIPNEPKEIKELKDNVTVEPTKLENVGDSVVKVHISLLDKLMNLVGELVVNRNQILQLSSEIENAKLEKLSNDLNTITTDLQNNIMNTRMQPVGIVLTKFERLVRDLSSKQKKKIQLKLVGQETELDKSLLEAIKDPLTHLIRNAIDHGMELPEDRIKLQKPEVGTVMVKAFHEGGMVNIVISDDGKGIDPKKILKKAIEKKIISDEKTKELSDKEIIQFIFAPGFSTAETVSDISGRGVGMDVVRTNIEKIGGSVDIDTYLGKGSSFILKIPLTLAIIPALIFESKGVFFSIPQINLSEFILLKENEVHSRIQTIQGEKFFRLRNKVIPLFDIANELELGTIRTILPNTQKIKSFTRQNIIVIHSDNVEFAISVDQITNFEEVVVKPLCPALKRLEIFSGATILGNGLMSLIVDVAAFVKRHNIINDDHQSHEHEISSAMNDFQLEYLVFSLFDHAKYCIPLSIVNRLEDFEISKIEKSESHYLVNYRGSSMPLVNLSSEIVNAHDDLIQLHKNHHRSRVRVLVVSYFSHFVGVVVDEILSTCRSSTTVDDFSNETPEVSGTLNINEKAITLVNLKYILAKKFQHKQKEQDVFSKKEFRKVLLYSHQKNKALLLKEVLEFDGYEVVATTQENFVVEYLNSYLSSTIAMAIDSEAFLSSDIMQKINQFVEKDSLKLIALSDHDLNEDELTADLFQVATSVINWQKNDFVEKFRSNFDKNIKQESAHLIENGKIQYCGLKIDKEFFAIPLTHVQEVLKPQLIFDVPKVSGPIKGLINLRGQIIPFLNLHNLLQLELSQNEKTKINLIVKNNEMLATISADEVFDIFEFTSDELSTVPDNIDPNRREMLSSVIKLNDKLISVLDMEKIIINSIS